MLQEGSNCAEMYVDFGLVGDLEKPDEITSILRIEPVRAFAKGQIMYPSGRKRKEGNWAISSEGQLATTSMERHLLFLLERLEPVKSELLEIASRLSVTVFFNCSWTFTEVPGGPIITSGTLKKMADLGAYLSFYTKMYEDFDEEEDYSNPKYDAI